MSTDQWKEWEKNMEERQEGDKGKKVIKEREGGGESCTRQRNHSPLNLNRPFLLVKTKTISGRQKTTSYVIQWWQQVLYLQYVKVWMQSFMPSVTPLFKLNIFIQNTHLIVLAHRRVLKPQEICITECGVLPHNSCVALLKMGSAEFNHCPYLDTRKCSFTSLYFNTS
jgi:hypothetical protein